MPNQWAHSSQLSMSGQTQALKHSMPNQWAHSSQLSMSRQTQALKHSMPNQWEHSFEPKKPFFYCSAI